MACLVLCTSFTHVWLPISRIALKIETELFRQKNQKFSCLGLLLLKQQNYTMKYFIIFILQLAIDALNLCLLFNLLLFFIFVVKCMPSDVYINTMY
jgi:hypothetical protein